MPGKTVERPSPPGTERHCQLTTIAKGELSDYWQTSAANRRNSAADFELGQLSDHDQQHSRELARPRQKLPVERLSELRASANAGLGKLDRPLRRALRLQLDGLPVEEIAAKCKLTKRGAEDRLRRAKEQLRQMA